MSIFETDETFYPQKPDISLDDISEAEILRNAIFTDELLLEINQKARTYEEIFSNYVTHALYQEDLIQNSLLYKAAERLYVVLKKGYALNLFDTEFIKNITLLFQHGKGDIYPKLLDKLPDILKLFISYHQAPNVEVHFWLQSMMAQLSIKDLMDCFNIQLSESENLEKDRRTLEPYLTALDSAFQKFDFDTGHEHKNDLLNCILKINIICNDLRRAKMLSQNKIKIFSEAFPASYQFLIDDALSLDLGCFLNGLIILSNMVFGGPSEQFIINLVKLTITTQAYTLPFSNHGVPLPDCLPFPHPKKMIFYTSFILSKKHQQSDKKETKKTQVDKTETDKTETDKTKTDIIKT
jgi:hypothetical protein